MSLQATTWAWRQKVAPDEKIVLLSMADRSDEYFNCHASFVGLIDDTVLTLDQINQVVEKLEKRGLILTMESPDCLRLKCRLMINKCGD